MRYVGFQDGDRALKLANGEGLFAISARTGILLAGVSILALAIGGVPQARAQQVIRLVTQGSDGTNAETVASFGPDATPGGDARGQWWQLQNHPISGTSATAIEVGAIGGRGGAGTGVFIGHNRPGAKGGNAGDVFVALQSPVSGGSDQKTSTALVSVYSIGGAGGGGWYNTKTETGFGIGGQAGRVGVNNDSIIAASGNAMVAISAISQGGASGARPTNGSSTGGTSEDRQAAEAGAVGGAVTVTNRKHPYGTENATISTSGNNAPAIYAASLGGAGGNADAVGATYHGSNGGAGGTVGFDNAGLISTLGFNSSAVILQSVGGLAGKGAGGAFSPAAGGSVGGNGGAVTGSNEGSLTTQGDYSMGLIAQSIGGGGGQGKGSAFGSGGDGGAAGNGDKVTLTNLGTISTAGAGSTGIVAQSIGGADGLSAFWSTSPSPSHGGGSGGGGGILPWSSGGTGGAGGAGGAVSLTQRGTITTQGDSAYGVLLQSVGGGGGTGGFTYNVNAFLSSSLGGAGGSGGDGGTVIYTGDWASGSIETSGSRAAGLLAQSIGGGGGAGGAASSLAIGYGLSASFAVGGKGGGGGDGGAVTVSNVNLITTWGQNAAAISAMSVGGGGGAGGNANVFSLALPPVHPGDGAPRVALSSATGGAGGDGGKGGAVTLENSNTLTTYGIGSRAVLLQSIGGGGGDAGDALAYALAISAPTSVSVSVASAIGGSGGGGGNGGTVSFSNRGDITTYGSDATGVLAQSIGGGGGNGGASAASANAISLRGAVMYDQSIGGSGGHGGHGGDVSMLTAEGNYGAVIHTYGDNAVALLGQSIGGGGGNGGSVNSAAATDLGAGEGLGGLAQKLLLGNNFTGSLTLGGTGGDGGNGGRVEITALRPSLLLTAGAHSSGIFAQSIGGGGGTGGGGTEKAAGTFAAKLSIGGTGGKGGTGGAVTVSQQGTITTRGDASYGIFAQSVGGGGGDGGNFTAAPSAAPSTISDLAKKIESAIGKAEFAEWVYKHGKPKTPAQLNTLIADLNGSEYISAVKKSALYKELSALNAFIKEQREEGFDLPNATLSLSMGGKGGAGNTGGDVKVYNAGEITTFGNVATGMFAQSIGGGGGNGGSAYGSGTSKMNLVVSLGGAGSTGGAGGSVVVTNEGRVQTGGDGAFGIMAQSVGGGGGTGVGALSGVNKPKSVTVDFAFGGSGGAGNVGGAVSVANSGAIVTTGAESHAILAQSVGGGGGAFLTNLETKDGQSDSDPADAVPESTMIAFLKTFGLDEVPKAETVDPKAAIISIASVNIAMGGSGGTGNHGGAVSVAHSGTISTSGMGAFGILAQSVGAGGGISDGAGASGEVLRAYSLGGKGGAGGNGGTVTIDLTGGGQASQISTSGEAATAVFAQSIGGGGGHGGASIFFGKTKAALTMASGSSGDGGAISISGGAGGTGITTTGNFAHGIWAQTLGGGGGTTGTVLNLPALAGTTTTASDRSASSGRGGTIDIAIANGAISATGTDSFGILAQSGFQSETGRLDASKAGGNITVNYTGTLVGGAGAGAAIGVDGGNVNLITIGAGSTVSALSGKAILASFGADTVVNHGTVIGDIDLSSGTLTGTWNTFTNAADGTYRSGGAGTITVGDRLGSSFALSTFTNRGAFDIGGVGKIGTATLTNGTMDLGGVLLTDVTSTSPVNGRTSDLLDAYILKVNGVSIRPNAVGGLLPGSFTVVTAQGLRTDGAPATASGSAASPISWSVSQSANALSISPSAAFVAKAESLTSSPLTFTERAMLESAQQAWNRSDTAMAPFFAQAANVGSSQQLGNLINSASASESNNLPAIGQALSALQSLHAAMSCPAFEGKSLEIHEGECVWARVTGSRLSRSANSQGEGFAQDTVDYRIGGQWEFAPDWIVGATAGYTTSALSTSDDLSSTSGTGADVSLALKHQMGPLLLAASVQGGYSRYQTNNNLVIGALQGLAASDTEVWSAGLKLRAAYEFTFDTWYLRPYVDLNILHTAMPGYSFTGSGITIESAEIDHWTGALETIVELGSRFNIGDKNWVRPYVSAGGTFIANNSITTRTTVSFGPLKGMTFDTTSELPSALLDIGAGVQVMGDDKHEIRGQYKAQLANDFVNQELSLRASLRF